MLLGKKRKRRITGGLGDASASEISTWIDKMKAQEGGRAPNKHKVNGNMAWHERAGKTSKPIYQLYKSFGKDSGKFLAHLDSQGFDVRAPANVDPPSVPGNDGGNSSGRSGQSSSDGGSAATPSPTSPVNTTGGGAPSAPAIDTNMKTYLMYGGAALGGILLLSMFTGN